MARAEVPLRLLIQTIKSAGERFPKRVQERPLSRVLFPAGVREIHRRGDTDFHPFGKFAQVDSRLPSRYANVLVTPSLSTGNIPNMEYRFWIGARNPSSKFSVCRGCRKIIHSDHERKQHMDKQECTKLLIEVYKLLRADKLCVMCDTRTSKLEWGIPLCGLPCKDAWMFTYERGRPAALIAGIELAFKRGYKTPQATAARVAIATEAELNQAISDARGIQREY